VLVLVTYFERYYGIIIDIYGLTLRQVSSTAGVIMFDFSQYKKTVSDRQSDF